MGIHIPMMPEAIGEMLREDHGRMVSWYVIPGTKEIACSVENVNRQSVYYGRGDSVFGSYLAMLADRREKNGDDDVR